MINCFKYIIKIPNILKKLAVLTSNLALFFKKSFNLNIYHFNTQIDLGGQSCSFCKTNKFTPYLSICAPAFNVNFIKTKLLKKFYLRSIGKCLNCDLLQDYNRPSLEDINELIKLYPSKDDMVSEEIWKTYPMPKEEISKYYQLHYYNKFLKWDEKLIFKNTPKKILFLRPTLGFDIEYFKERYKYSKAYFADISKISEKTILEKYPEVKKINLDIHAIYRGNFEKYNNYFDLIISHHNLVHVYNLDDTLVKIKNLISLNGSVLFSGEISIKPWNPFHYNFYDEIMFNKILEKYFCKVKKIKEDNSKSLSFVSSPCFIVSKS